ncbi:MAG TPA: hypothetical protein VGM83_11735 [Devosiaceae bacterium]|jgi:protein ImuA
MDGLRQSRLETLRTQIAALEKRPMLAEGAAVLRRRGGAGVLATAPGLVHEVFTDEMRNAGAALGFALGQARAFLTPERPAVFYLQLAHEGQERGVPYGAGLAAFGFAPENLAIVRVKAMPELLWAMEEALGCRAVAGVVADIGGHPKILDFTASRRLSLRAASGGASVFLMRYGVEREASAAQLRWRIDPAPSGTVRFDPRAPGEARWRVTLEKGVAGANAAPGGNWLVSWEDGFDVAQNERRPIRHRLAG